MKRNLLFLIALFVCALSFGQGEIDAYRFSNNDLSGTARGQAMGGAFGALGGDMTGVAINPAGIGIYRSSELLANMSITSPLLSGNTNQQSNTRFNFNNISYVGYYPLVKGSMLSLNFGFNFNRIKNFSQQYSASRPSMNSSITDYMLSLTDGIDHSVWTGNTDDNYSDPNLRWLSVLAWDGYLINEKAGTNNAYESILQNGEQVSPSLKVSEKGKIDAYDFTVGSNIADRFFWGVTFSATDVLYQLNSSYDEQFLGVPGSGLNLENYLQTRGSGFQMKLGVIVKPVDALRIGISYHSPTWYAMKDYYQATLIPRLTPRGIYDQNGNEVGYTQTPYDSYSYQFRTPGSWTFSLAGILSTKALLSVDYEIKDYSYMNFQDVNGNTWEDVQNKVQSDYKSASMIRAGFEYRFTPQFSGRIGYALQQNPYRMDINSMGDNVVTAGTVTQYVLPGDVHYMTAGIGYKFTPQFYGDLALVLRSQQDDLYYFPPVSGIQGAGTDSFAGRFTNKTLKGLITLGYKF